MKFLMDRANSGMFSLRMGACAFLTSEPPCAAKGFNVSVVRQWFPFYQHLVRLFPFP